MKRKTSMFNREYNASRMRSARNTTSATAQTEAERVLARYRERTATAASAAEPNGAPTF